MSKHYNPTLKSSRYTLDEIDVHAIRMARGRLTMKELAQRYHKSVPTIQAIQSFRLHKNVEITDEERRLCLTPIAELRDISRDKLKNATAYTRQLHQLISLADSMLFIAKGSKHKSLREFETAFQIISQHLRDLLVP